MRKKKIIAAIMCVAVTMCGVITALADNVSPTVSPMPMDDINITIDGKTLVKDKDYTLSYRDNVKVGTATVVVTFIGNYSGQREVNFDIVRKKSSHSSSSTNLNTTVKIMQDNDLIMTTQTNGKVQVTIPKLIEYQSMYKVYVSENGVAKINEDVEILDEKGRTLRGRTDKNGIAYLSVVATSTPIMISQTQSPTNIHKPYIFGYEDGTFKPDGFVTRAETASMMNNIIEIRSTNKNVSFSDIVNAAWYTTIIKNMSSAGIINGYTDGTFRPDNYITRAEFVTMIMQSENIQNIRNSPFTDVDAKLWSSDYIYSANQAGYIDGYSDGTFKPDNAITRAEAVKIINSYLKRTDLKSVQNPFSDLTERHWAYKQILEAAVEHLQ